MPPRLHWAGRQQEVKALGDPGLWPLWGPNLEKLWSWPGGWGIAASRPAAVARDERPGVGLLADGQAGPVEAWGGGGEITICEGCQV